MPTKKLTHSRRYVAAIVASTLLLTIWGVLLWQHWQSPNDNFYGLTRAIIDGIISIVLFLIGGYSVRDTALSLKGGYKPDQKIND